ncbi:CerR family C-terminal domain-containing protein [Halomonas salifodinae]|uniref:CerR family C-terminal domain-containing protein n=1 Tax=Halomonas salifodinae TaxID=438745 RepID=A0ABW2ET27_9GAMM
MNQIANSAETRERLIQAAIQLFGEHGFKGTTTRQLAEAAGANIGSIAYHFTNKHGLYLASAAYIADELHRRLAPPPLPAPTDREASLATLRTLVARMVHTFTEDDDCRQWLLLVIREQVSPGEAFDILQARAFQPIQMTLSALIARLTGRDPDDRRVILETHTLVGQIVFFLVGREPLLRRLGQDGYDAATVAEIEALMAAQLARYA